MTTTSIFKDREWIFDPNSTYYISHDIAELNDIFYIIFQPCFNDYTACCLFCAHREDRCPNIYNARFVASKHYNETHRYAGDAP